MVVSPEMMDSGAAQDAPGKEASLGGPSEGLYSN